MPKELFLFLFLAADTGGGGSGSGTSEPPKEDTETRLKKLEESLSESNETNKRLKDSLKLKDKELESLKKEHKESLNKNKEVLKTSLVELDKIREGLTHLGIKMDVDPSVSSEENFREANEKIKKEFKLEDYKLSDLDYENDFENLLSLAKEKLMTNKKIGGLFSILGSEINYLYEDTLEFKFLVKKGE